MALRRLQMVEFLDPRRLGREGPFPALGAIRAEAFTPDEVLALRRAEPRPIHVAFPVKDAGEAANLDHLLTLLDPLAPAWLDGGWLAFGGEDPGQLLELTRKYPWLRLFDAKQFPPPDQRDQAWGKGAVMRALVYYLIETEKITDPRTVLQFVDADIKPAYFNKNWFLGPVGTVLWFKAVEAAKIVYFRPQGGRLNTFLRSLLAILPHAGLERLNTLLYLLSGEMAATLQFWSSVPFKTGYGIEILLLLSLALEQVRLQPDRSDLEQVAQVFVGAMDHRHAPLHSAADRPGLDQMAANVFATVFETLEQAGAVAWAGTRTRLGQVLLPMPGTEPAGQPEWLQVPVGEATLPPLKELPEIAAALKG
jgi:hypothetical protein